MSAIARTAQVIPRRSVNNIKDRSTGSATGKTLLARAVAHHTESEIPTKKIQTNRPMHHLAIQATQLKLRLDAQLAKTPPLHDQIHPRKASFGVHCRHSTRDHLLGGSDSTKFLVAEIPTHSVDPQIHLSTASASCGLLVCIP